MPKPWSFGISFSAVAGILDPLANLPGDEVGNQPVRFPVDHHVTEITLPDAEARPGIELLPERLALGLRDLERAPRVDRVDEAGGGL